MINRKLINQGLCILLGGMMAIGGACLPVLAGECDAGSTVIAVGEAQTEAAEENAAGEPEGIDAGEDTAEAEERQEEEAEITEMDISAEDNNAEEPEHADAAEASGAEQAEPEADQEMNRKKRGWRQGLKI